MLHDVAETQEPPHRVTQLGPNSVLLPQISGRRIQPYYTVDLMLEQKMQELPPFTTTEVLVYFSYSLRLHRPHRSV